MHSPVFREYRVSSRGQLAVFSWNSIRQSAPSAHTAGQLAELHLDAALVVRPLRICRNHENARTIRSPCKGSPRKTCNANDLTRKHGAAMTVASVWFLAKLKAYDSSLSPKMHLTCRFRSASLLDVHCTVLWTSPLQNKAARTAGWTMALRSNGRGFLCAGDGNDAAEQPSRNG